MCASRARNGDFAGTRLCFAGESLGAVSRGLRIYIYVSLARTRYLRSRAWLAAATVATYCQSRLLFVYAWIFQGCCCRERERFKGSRTMGFRAALQPRDCRREGELCMRWILRCCFWICFLTKFRRGGGGFGDRVADGPSDRFV